MSPLKPQAAWATAGNADREAVGSIGITDEVRGRGRSDLHTPAQVGVPCREALPDNGRIREID